MDGPAILLYDGACAFCSRGVRFLYRRDPHARLRYATLQSDTGRELARQHGHPADKLDTVLLIEGSRGASARSTAALRATLRLRAPWPLVARVGLLVPRAWRDRIYDATARRRHRLSRSHACPAPEAGLRERIME